MEELYAAWLAAPRPETAEPLLAAWLDAWAVPEPRQQARLHARLLQAAGTADAVLLRSNGTTDAAAAHALGPHGPWTITAVERRLRRPDPTRRLINVHDRFWGTGSAPPVELPGGKLDGSLQAHPRRDFDWLLARVGGCDLFVQPRTALALLSGDPGRAARLAAADVRLVNVDLPPLYPRRGVRVHDQMIDWATGVAFRDCAAGRPHFWPGCHVAADRAFNLLNLADRRGRLLTDHLAPRGVEDCPCGRRRARFDFIPCWRHAPAPWAELAAAFGCLVGDYESLQLWTNGTHATLCWVGELATEDLRALRAALGPVALGLAPQRWFRVGLRKAPALWRSPCPPPVFRFRA